MMPDLDALQALCDAATPGPWVWVDDGWSLRRDAPEGETLFEQWYVLDLDCTMGHVDAALIAASRSALPELIAEVRRLQAAIAALGGGV